MKVIQLSSWIPESVIKHINLDPKAGLFPHTTVFLLLSHKPPHMAGDPQVLIMSGGLDTTKEQKHKAVKRDIGDGHNWSSH